MRRNKHIEIIAVLGVFLVLFIIISAFRNITVYVVYKSGIGTFIVIGMIVLAIVVLFLKGRR